MAAARNSTSTSRVHRGELISSAGALALLVTMFLLEWYGVDGIPGRATSRALARVDNAWHALTVTRWLMLATIAVTLGSAVVHVRQRSHGAKTDTGLVVSTMGSATAVLLTYRVLIDPPWAAAVVDQKLGAVLGVLSAFAIAGGGYETLRAERAQAGKFAQRSEGSDTVESSRVAR